MSSIAHRIADRSPRFRMIVHARPLADALRVATPSLLFGLRLWASVSLALYAAFQLQLDNPFWAGASAAIICQPQLGASLRKGWFRMLGTLVGATMSVVLIACFPQDRLLFLGALAVWAAVCAFGATLLRNFASYAASLAGYTAAIIAGDLLGTVGGIDGNAAFLLAVSRGTEICLGIACAGVVLAGTDFGGARRRVAAQLAELTGGIAGGLVGTLSAASNELSDTRTVRREFLRRAIALDPVVDQALGESSEIRYHSPIVGRALDGLYSALAGWHAAADHLNQLPADAAHREAVALSANVPRELRTASEQDVVAQSLAAPIDVRRTCATAAGHFESLAAATPSRALLANKAALAFTSLADTLDGIALFAGVPDRPVSRRGTYHLHVPDWLPPLVSGARTFITVSCMALFWMMTGWPGGALAMTFAAIVELLLAPRADETFGAALIFAIGAVLDLILTAIVAFAILPGLPTDDFVGLCLVLGACLIPIGTLLKQAKQPWQVGLLTAMTMGFVPILQPTNPEIYNPDTFYNIGLPIVVGMASAALSFRLLPPLSPGFRARRLLALTLRDVRRLAMGRRSNHWEGRVVGRLSVMPDEATALQRAQLLAALSVGGEIIHLRKAADPVGLGAKLGVALAALAEGRSAKAIIALSGLDEALATNPANVPGAQDVQRMRGSILAIFEVLARHAEYFDAGAPG